jgi:hypothetical protein
MESINSLLEDSMTYAHVCPRNTDVEPDPGGVMVSLLRGGIKNVKYIIDKYINAIYYIF